MNFVLLREPASDVCQGNRCWNSKMSLHFFFSESLIVLTFTFRSIHFDVTFLVYFSILSGDIQFLYHWLERPSFSMNYLVSYVKNQLLRTTSPWFRTLYSAMLLIDLSTMPTVLIFVTVICSEVKWCKVNFAAGQRFQLFI